MGTPKYKKNLEPQFRESDGEPLFTWRWAQEQDPCLLGMISGIAVDKILIRNSKKKMDYDDL